MKSSSSKAGKSKRRTGAQAKAKNIRGTPKVRTSRSRTGTTLLREPPEPSGETDAKTTTDLNVIKAWAEPRGGKPGWVKGGDPESEAGLLRIYFPGGAEASPFEVLSWEDWGARFEEQSLAFLYWEKTKEGQESRAYKLVIRK